MVGAASSVSFYIPVWYIRISLQKYEGISEEKLVQGTDDFNDRHKPQGYAGMMHSPSRVLHVFA